MIQELLRFIIQKIKMFSSGIQRLFAPQSILGKVKTAVKRVIDKVFRIKPRDEHDYYTVGWFMVSKRLVSMILFVVGIVGIYYLLTEQTSLFSKDDTGVKTYSYDSIRLRFADGTVKIKTKSGYIGYYGEVSDGKANGDGILYASPQNVRYDGAFKDSEYSGEGKLYGDNGNVLYTGNFEHNLYQGEGTLYHDNGSVEYMGNFDNGVKEGEGKLFDVSSNAVYSGNFINDEINYVELLGNSTVDINKIYTGQRTIYFKDDEFVVNMSDIDAYYGGNSQESNLNDEVIVNQVYVNKKSCIINGKKVTSISQIKEMIGEPGFEGTSNIKLSEAVILGKATEKPGDIKDAVEIEKFDQDAEIYLTVFECDDIQYTFYSEENSDEFIMYAIEK